MRRENPELLYEPVIQRPVDIELQSAYRMRDMLYRVALPVGVVIHRVDAPLVPGPVMARVDDPVHYRVAEKHVRMGHVDLCPEHFLSIRILPVPHFPEQAQILPDAAVPPRALLSGSLDSTAPLPDLLLGLVIHVCQPFPDQVFRPFIKLLEIVRGIPLVLPLESEPVYVLLYRIHIFRVLLDRVGVVKAEVSLAAVFLRQPEIEAYTLGMSYMQIAVRLRRETGHDALTLPRCEVSLYDLLQKIQVAGLSALFDNFFHILF